MSVFGGVAWAGYNTLIQNFSIAAEKARKAVVTVLFWLLVVLIAYQIAHAS